MSVRSRPSFIWFLKATSTLMDMQIDIFHLLSSMLFRLWLWVKTPLTIRRTSMSFVYNSHLKNQGGSEEVKWNAVTFFICFISTLWVDLNYIFLDRSSLDQNVTNVKESTRRPTVCSRSFQALLYCLYRCHVRNTSCRAKWNTYSIPDWLSRKPREFRGN